VVISIAWAAEGVGGRLVAVVSQLCRRGSP
jgi:hypothetical protein